MVHTFELHQARFESSRDRIVGRKRSALRKPKVYQYLEPAGVGEELLLHFAHSDNTERQRGDGHANRDPAMAHTGIHQCAETAVKRRVEQIVRLAVGCRTGLFLEQQSADVRHEIHRYSP